MRFDAGSLPAATREDPLRILVSGCLAGWACLVDGTAYGDAHTAAAILRLPVVRVVPFCPEDVVFGTPRDTPNCVGGDGNDVLAGRARVVMHDGTDVTDGMIAGAHAMLHVARENDVALAILMDISAACGSQVLYDGHRDRKRYQRGAGVAAALLMQNGIPVVSQRDNRTLQHLRVRLDPTHVADLAAIDHDETEWYRTYFRVDAE